MKSLRYLLIILLVISSLISPVYSKEETEPNNIIEEANSVLPGETVLGHTGLKTEYGLSGDVDVFSIQVTGPGKLTLYAGILKKWGTSDGTPSIRMSIINGDELKVSEWKNPYSGKFESPVFTEIKTEARSISFQKSGTMYIKVDRYEADAYYKFTVDYKSGGQENLPVPDPIEEVEPNDIPSKANILPLRQPIIGHTGNMGKYGLEGNKDYFLVDVPSPGKLTVFLTVKGKYSDSESGEPSLKVTMVNEDEMASGAWKDVTTGINKSPVFYQGTEGCCIFIKYGGEVLLNIDRYQANAKYKMIVLFQTGE